MGLSRETYISFPWVPSQGSARKAPVTDDHISPHNVHTQTDANRLKMPTALK